MEIYPNHNVENMIEEIRMCMDLLESYIPDNWPYAQPIRDSIMDWRNQINSIEEESEIIISSSNLDRVPPLKHDNGNNFASALSKINSIRKMVGLDDDMPEFFSNTER